MQDSPPSTIRGHKLHPLVTPALSKLSSPGSIHAHLTPTRPWIGSGRVARLPSQDALRGLDGGTLLPLRFLWPHQPSATLWCPDKMVVPVAF